MNIKKNIISYTFCLICTTLPAMQSALAAAGADDPETLLPDTWPPNTEVCYLYCGNELHDPSVTCSVGFKCAPGCSYDQKNFSCLQCEPGTYLPPAGTGSAGLHDLTMCSHTCSTPKSPNNSTKYSFDDDLLNAYGNTQDNCPWRLVCQSGYYWDNTEKGCYKCRDGYHGNDKDLEFFGSGSTAPNSTNNSHDDRCIPNEYKITLKHNNPYTENLPKTYSDQTITLVWDNGIDGQSSMPSKYNQPSTEYYKFLGYYSSSDDASDVNLVISTSGEFDQMSLRSYDEKNLYAQYEIHGIQIWYLQEYNGGDISTKADVSFNVKHNSDAPERTVKALPKTWYKHGKVFTHYNCFIVDTKKTSCATSKYDPDDTFMFTDELQRVLVPHYRDCKAGYYCPNGIETPCPAGSTSAAGAKTEQECYIDGGTNFCDQYGCFNLGDIKIYSM